MTEVVRGEDLLPSTPRQELLQRALALPHPAWVHVPLVVDDGGERLAKRRDDLALATLREAGVDPRAVVGWAARSIGLEEVERCSPAEVLGDFRLESIPRKPVRFGAAELARLLSERTG